MSEKDIPQSDIRWIDKDFKFPVLDLRDYFAAKAMQSIYLRLGGSPICDPNDVGYIADNAYRMADAMLEARKS